MRNILIGMAVGALIGAAFIQGNAPASEIVAKGKKTLKKKASGRFRLTEFFLKQGFPAGRRKGKLFRQFKVWAVFTAFCQRKLLKAIRLF